MLVYDTHTLALVLDPPTRPLIVDPTLPIVPPTTVTLVDPVLGPLSPVTLLALPGLPSCVIARVNVPAPPLVAPTRAATAAPPPCLHTTPLDDIHELAWLADPPTRPAHDRRDMPDPAIVTLTLPLLAPLLIIVLLITPPYSDPSPPSYDACWLIDPTALSTVTATAILPPPEPNALLLHCTLLSLTHIVLSALLPPTPYRLDTSHSAPPAPDPTIVTLLAPVLAAFVGVMLLAVLLS